jgi:hypothetical protein
MNTALPMTWLMPIAVRFHLPSSRRSVSAGADAETIDAGTVALIMPVGFF